MELILSICIGRNPEVTEEVNQTGKLTMKTERIIEIDAWFLSYPYYRIYLHQYGQDKI